MAFDSAVLQNYEFDRNVFVRFIDRNDFTLAKYRSISLDGFTCYSEKAFQPGEMNRVEVNLKMITRGTIDDVIPHIASVTFDKATTENGQRVCWFSYVDFKNNCFDNLINALMFLDRKEKVVSLPVVAEEVAGKSIDDFFKDITNRIRSGGFVLPVLPRIFREVDSLVRAPDTTIDDLVAVIEQDAVISVKLLATANSPFYRTDDEIKTIREAIPRFGLKEIRNLILTIVSKSFYQSDTKEFTEMFRQLWRHSLATAYSANALAETKNFDNLEIFYTAGLIHDIGKTVLLRFLSDMNSQGFTFDQNEIATALERFSPLMSKMILKHWGFSDSFNQAVCGGSKKSDSKPTEKFRKIVVAAGALAADSGYDILPATDETLTDRLSKSLGIEIERVERLKEHIKDIMENTSAVF